MEQKLSFSGVFLYMDDKKLSLNNLKEKLSAGQYRKESQTKVQAFDLIYDHRYLRISFGDGSLGPRNPIVFNLATQEEEENPRQKIQVEPRQSFALIDFDTSFLWITNSKKRGAIIELIKDKFPTSSVVAKDIYNEEQFINTLRRLDTIKVSAVPNLLSQTAILSERLAEEINGYEANIATIVFGYHHKITSDHLISKVRSIFEQRNSLRSIVIAGRDENDLGMLFNTEGFSRKIDIEAAVDEDEMFDAENVFEKLTYKIESEAH